MFLAVFRHGEVPVCLAMYHEDTVMSKSCEHNCNYICHEEERVSM